MIKQTLLPIDKEDTSKVRAALSKESIKVVVKKGNGSCRYELSVTDTTNNNLQIVEIVRSLGYQVDYQDTCTNKIFFNKVQGLS